MKQVDAAHYQSLDYLSKARFSSYWYQISEVIRFKPASILEIGPGPGLVTSLLRKLGYEVTTLDFADDVGADIVASVLDMPFQDSEFDVVLCSQVLEHLPFEEFERAISEISRVCQIGGVISLPHTGRVWPFQFHIPLYGPLRFGFNLQLISREHVFDGQHHWEIGRRGFPVSRIETILKRHFKTTSTYRVFENVFHRFFICKK